jgi:hypothetical protein
MNEDEYADTAPDESEPTQQFGFLDGAFGRPSYDGQQHDAAHEPATPRRATPTWVPGTDGPGPRRSLKAAAIGVAALALVAGAFGVGRLMADSTATSAASEHSGSSAAEARRQQPYDGRVRAVGPARSSATCQAPSSVDAAGNPVTYEPMKAHDSDLTTAWRCDGSGAEQSVTLQLPRETPVAEVGLVPGYAKTDPANGVDRYAENNRITRVRWRFDDGTTFVQRMSADPADRSMRTMRIPVTKASEVVLEILSSERGPRNTVAISEIRLATPAN